MFHKPVFYSAVRRSIFGRLSEGQVFGMEAILDSWLARPALTDDRWLAYMLATAAHETAKTMQPVRETLAASDDAAIRILDKAFAKGRLPWVKTPYWRRDSDGKTWLGRGLVQLTHKANYIKLSRQIGTDLVADPDRAMDLDIAVTIMFDGMMFGLFTGHRLADHFDGEQEDPVSARMIINGTESAMTVARLYLQFKEAIKGARKG
jgi:predicted chitinase